MLLSLVRFACEPQKLRRQIMHIHLGVVLQRSFEVRSVELVDGDWLPRFLWRALFFGRIAVHGHLRLYWLLRNPQEIAHTLDSHETQDRAATKRSAPRELKINSLA